MPKTLSYEATEWFCDNCPASSIVIRKNDYSDLLPEGWGALKITRKWYQRDKWQVLCNACYNSPWVKNLIRPT